MAEETKDIKAVPTKQEFHEKIASILDGFKKAHDEHSAFLTSCVSQIYDVKKEIDEKLRQTDSERQTASDLRHAAEDKLAKVAEIEGIANSKLKEHQRLVQQSTDTQASLAEKEEKMSLALKNADADNLKLQELIKNAQTRSDFISMEERRLQLLSMKLELIQNDSKVKEELAKFQ